MTPSASLSGPAEPTHPCARCGLAVAAGVGLCERCNPLGLRDVASSQVHGTVFVVLALGIVALAIVARLAVAGVGPFSASVDEVIATADGLTVTLTVQNEGDGAAQTTCRVGDPAGAGNRAAFVLTPRLEAGERRTFQRTVTELGSTVRPLVVDCRTP
ncbi:MAG: hypothetical protein ACLGIJ_06875 [Candidatus Limnocylindria bacterium]